MGDYDYGRENGLWGDDGIPYGIDTVEYSDADYGYENLFSQEVHAYVQLMKRKGIKTIVAMNNYLTKNGLWDDFSSIQRYNTFASGFKSIGVSRQAYSDITSLYQTNDIIHDRLESSKKVSKINY